MNYKLWLFASIARFIMGVVLSIYGLIRSWKSPDDGLLLIGVAVLLLWVDLRYPKERKESQ